MEESSYLFPIDTESQIFFDIIVWSIQKCSNYHYNKSIDLINCFYESHPRLWDDYWYEHEGFTQLIAAIFYEESVQGKYRDLNFSMFRQQFIVQHRDILSSLGLRHGKVISKLDFYPVDEKIEARINCIEKCLDPFWAIF